MNINHGGPAFPRPASQYEDHDGVMTEFASNGMSLRAYIAVAALPIVFRASGIEGPLSGKEAASIGLEACKLADALIAALEQSS